MVYEVVDNAIDEALAGYADQCRGHDSRRQLGDRQGQRPRHPGRHPQGGGAFRRRGHHDRAARRREVRQQLLQGLRRPSRRRRLGGQLPLGMARAGDPSRRQRLAAALRARTSRRPDREGRKDHAARNAGDVQGRRRDLLRHGDELRDARAASPRAGIPQLRHPDRDQGRAHREAPRVPLRRRDRLLRPRPEQEQDAAPRGADLHPRREGRRAGRDRHAVERRLHREHLLLHEHDQEPRRRRASHRLQGCAHANGEQVRRRHRRPRKAEALAGRRRHPRRADGHHLGQGPRPEVLVADQGQARSPRT